MGIPMNLESRIRNALSPWNWVGIFGLVIVLSSIAIIDLEIGVVAGILVVSAWAFLQSPFTFALGQIAIAVIIQKSTVNDVFWIIQLGLFMILFESMSLYKHGLRISIATVLLTIVTIGIIWTGLRMSFDGSLFALLIIFVFVILTYGLKRYERVKLANLTN